MAKIEKISLGGVFDTTEIINVSAPVGPRGINNKADVMVVQALFKFISARSRGGKSPNGIPDSECPEPTGTFDKVTAGLIKKFQAKYHPRISQDGMIHPAKNGKYEWGCRRMWTIVHLNSLVTDKVLMNNINAGPVQAVINQFPQLDSVLERLIDI